MNRVTVNASRRRWLNVPHGRYHLFVTPQVVLLTKMKNRLVYYLVGCLAAKAAAQYQFYNLTAADTNLSATCLAVLNQAVACDSSVAWAGHGRYEDDATLGVLCTATCTKQLSIWLTRVTGACTTRYVDALGAAVLPAYWIETIVENYNLLCLQNRLVDLGLHF
jgi:hypothetical protein